MIQDALKIVVGEGRSLSRAEARECFTYGLSGNADPVVLGGLLVAMAQRGETIEEITGAAEALRSCMTPFEHDYPDAIDTCGTGGDGLGMFNISTTSAIVAAAAGARVIKHGNRAVSSSCGSADLLEAAGVKLELSPEAARTCLDETGITFLFAPRYHPAMRHAGPVRRALGIRTIFNLLGPLANPGSVQRQVLGVANPSYLKTHSTVLQELGAERAMVIHGGGGADELTLEDGNQIQYVPVDGGPISLRSEELGLGAAPVSALQGSDANHNLSILHRVLGNEAGPLRDVVILNAAAALWVADIASDLKDGVARADEALASGTSQALLARWVELSGQLG
ncbi:MAG: anthranilate phosphoribosyltransferase [Myxococcales bacterium]|nr:anthranilate phosphoribosyltransferase [Myxococcales bacterium]